SYTMLGKAELALSSYKKVIQYSKITSHQYERSMSFLAISQISKFDADARKLILDDVEKSISSSTKSNLLFALANACEKEWQFDDAFNFYTRANDLKAREFNYDKRIVDLHAEEIIRFFTEETRDALSGNQASAASPIFIVGLPRTGTTLVESILSCCESINPCGEVGYLPEIVQRVTASQQAGESYPEVLSKISAADYNELAGIYLSATGNSQKVRSTDKLPANFWHIGFINMLFPQAKIINCCKNPLDTCFSLFKQSFQEGHAYSYSLDDCADYFLTYRKLMAHWRSLYPQQIFELNYESLVLNPKDVSSELYRFCGLEWKDSYLDEHVKRGSVKTGSALQIRSKINKLSLNRWKNYNSHLMELKNKLKI
ncbi:MAG: sulfotransferase, partial [Kangiellaceae bacterium]|nr:sulfotransferase [Kangiellaceae bacterium]